MTGSAELFGRSLIRHYAANLDLRGEPPLEELLNLHGIEWAVLSKDQPTNRLPERLPEGRRAAGIARRAATLFSLIGSNLQKPARTEGACSCRTMRTRSLCSALTTQSCGGQHRLLLELIR